MLPDRGLLRDPERGAARCEALLAAFDAVAWTLSADGQCREPQPAWSAYTGQSREACQGLGWLDAIHEQDRAAVAASWQAALAEGSLFMARCRLRHAPSHGFRGVAMRAVPVRGADGTVLEWLATITDLHDRGIAELHRLNQGLVQQLEAQALEMRRLFELSLDVLVSLDAGGRLLSVSPSFERVTGMPAASAVGRHYSEFVVESELQKVADEVASVLGGRQAVDFETQLRHADGRTRIVSWRAVALVSEARLYAVGRDVTEQKRAQERSIRAERLEAVGRLAGGIAHDFNNVLAAMMGYLEVGVRRSRDEQLTRLFKSALDAGRRGAKLVEQLLGFARKQALAIQPVVLNKLVNELLPLLRQALRDKPSVHLELDLQPDLPKVWVDATQIEMVVLNLVINARDAVPESGRIVIRTWEHQVSSASSRIDDLPEGRYGCLSVVDTGTGMDRETLARCFEPFYTTKPPGHGTGLGLAQALGIVQHCGGAMRVDSRPGTGTRVDVILPAVQPGQPGQATTPPTMDHPAVLVVDDDPHVLQSTSELLDALGHQAIPAGDGKTAISLLVGGMPVEVVLADFNMPDMSGVELLRQVFHLRPKVTGIIMSGELEPERIQAQLPGVTVLRKPLQPSRLAALIAERVADHRRATGEMERD